jgi:UDP-N-acetylmuramate: L-alanyl-gamma-D-glutamyl-meso-diaminopimelate ligase
MTTQFTPPPPARHIHVLGICGTFMGGLAAIAREAGLQVTGCDANVYPPMSDQLRALGIELIEGFDASQLALKPDLWVIGNVVSRGNPLMEAILDAGLPFTSGPEWLSSVLQGRHVLAVAGTHGKTTTTALLAWILQHQGLQPGYLIGGVAQNFPSSAHLGQGHPFVIEADEYDTAFFDKRSKFVHYRPRTAILNNLEFDHADIFPDVAAIQTQFHHLVRTVPGQGHVIVNATQPTLAQVLDKGCWSQLHFFMSPQGWHEADVVETPEATEFELRFSAQSFGRLRLQLSGAHNRANALAAIAAAGTVGVEPAAAIQALEAFAGIKRRMEVKGVVRGVTVIDDFAHHPTAIATTLEGLRMRLGTTGGRILAVLEPRSNTMKLGTMAALLPESLRLADRVFCSSAGLGWDVASALAPLQPPALVADSVDALVQAISQEARTGDTILVMSNGGFGGIHGKLLAALQAGAEQ